MNLATETGAEAGAVALDVERMAPIEVLVGPERFPITLARLTGMWGGVGSLLALTTLLLARHVPGVHPVVVGSILGVGVLAGTVAVLMPRWFSPTVIWLLVLAAAVGSVVVLGLLGPRLDVGVAFVVASGAFCPIWFGRWRGIAAVAVFAVGYAAVLTSQAGYLTPAGLWIFVVGVMVMAATALDWFIGLIRNLAVTERATHRELVLTHAQLQEAHGQLADLNHTLEARVATQVAEIEALNRLRRFLSPQVAEAVLTAGDEAVLQPHRRQIAVFFCDLRGFTAFTGGAEAEEVVEALDAYYHIVGSVLRRHDATVGTFAGDGIMAYLNDPVPCHDPAGIAVQMAIELREPMAEFVDAWKRRGYDLGYGVGIAYGYATLGTIGFEGRNDYTALGSVVNLAARLCGEAGSGEVLVDSRTSDALGQRFDTVAREVTLKGFASPVAAFEVAG